MTSARIIRNCSPHVAKRWLKGASDERRWIVKHALRSAIKRADAGALGALGMAARPMSRCAPCASRRRAPGSAVTSSIGFEVVNKSPKRQRVMADLVVHFVKARGTGAKTFKLRVLDLAPGARETVAKKITLTQLTTRRHYPGVHRVEALLNGSARKLGTFELRAASR